MRQELRSTLLPPSPAGETDAAVADWSFAASVSPAHDGTKEADRVA